MKNTFLFFFLFLYFSLFSQQEKWMDKYDKVYPLSKNNHTWRYVKKGHFYGAVNQHGKELVPIIYSNIIENDFGGVMIFEKDGKWGIFSPQGKSVAAFIYDKILFAEDRYGTFERNHKWGYIDSDGEEMIPPQYDMANLMYNDRGPVLMGEKWAIINHEGHFKSNFIFDKVDDFDNFQSKVIYKGNYGIIDTACKWIIMPMYQEIYIHQQLYHAQKNGKWGFLNGQQEIIIPFEYDNQEICSLWTKNGLICAKKNGKWGYFNHSGTLVVPFEYDEILSFYHKLGPVFKEGKWGFVDNTGTLVIPFMYDSLYTSCWGEKWVGAKREGKWTLISEEGKELLPPTFEHIECILDDGDPARIQLNGKWGYINENGETIIPCIYDEAELFPNYKGLFQVKKEGKILWLDKQGKEVKPNP